MDPSKACLLCLQQVVVVVVVDGENIRLFPHCCHSLPRCPNDTGIGILFLGQELQNVIYIEFIFILLGQFDSRRQNLSISTFVS